MGNDSASKRLWRHSQEWETPKSHATQSDLCQNTEKLC